MFKLTKITFKVVLFCIFFACAFIAGLLVGCPDLVSFTGTEPGLVMMCGVGAGGAGLFSLRHPFVDPMLKPRPRADRAQLIKEALLEFHRVWGDATGADREVALALMVHSGDPRVVRTFDTLREVIELVEDNEDAHDENLFGEINITVDQAPYLQEVV